MQIGGIEHMSLNDGPGVRVSVFFSGCKHNCKGCHNPELQNFKAGSFYTAKKLLNEINESIEMADGITLTGGDPIFQFPRIIPFLKLFRKQWPTKNIMLYTGFTFQQISEMNPDILKYCDYIMDGRFVLDKSDHDMKWRGSSNQNLYHKLSNTWFKRVEK